MRRILLLLSVLTVVSGCGAVEGPIERYRLERQLWRAQFYERRINISFMRASRHDTEMAITAFRRVLASDPIADGRAASWEADVVDDIRAIQIVSRIALANLYFLSERYVDAGTLYRETLETGNLSIERTLEARLGVARSLYLAGENQEVMEQCASIFRELSGNPELLHGEREIGPVFMNVPVALVRMYQRAGDEARAAEFSRMALAFYDRVAAERGGSDTAWQAALGGLQVCLARRDWNAALTRLETLLRDEGLAPGARAEFSLLRGEIVGFALGDVRRAAEILEAVVSAFPGTGAELAARYDLGVLASERGDDRTALRIFRELEQDARAPGAIASRAMIARARVHDRRGEWDDAYALYRRVEQLYPYTAAAIEAPLRVTRYYVRAGEHALAQRSLDRARDYYLSLLDRSSAFGGDRLLVQAALAETFLAAGRGADVADLLGSGSARWDETSTVAGMLKSAEVYATELGDRARAVEMLKKCIERFPETRYASVAQSRLDELEGRPE